jgi:hypothetical protein
MPTLGPESASSVVRAMRTSHHGRQQWLGIVCAPADAAGALTPQPSVDAMIAEAEAHLVACGIGHGALQITLFFEL